MSGDILEAWFMIIYVYILHVRVSKLCVTDRSKAILLLWFLLFYVLVFNFFVLFAPYVCYHILVKFR